MLLNIKFEPKQIDNDWGFYVDIENNSFPENKLNYDFKREKYNNFIQYFETNYEEYDIYSNITENDNKNDKFINFILKASLTSFITAIIIYVIFVVL